MKHTVQELEIACEIADDLIGHISMESVTCYVVKSINEKYGTSFEDTLDLVDFAQGMGVEIEECPECGWYVDYLTDVNPEDEELEQPMCVGCAEYK